MKIGSISITKDSVEQAETVAKSWLGDARFLLLIGFGLLLYFAKSVLTFETMVLLASLAAFYMLCHTVSHIVETIGETKLRSERQRLAWTDGVLTAAEVEVIKSADEIAAGGARVIAPPAPAPAPAPAPTGGGGTAG